MPRHAWPVNNCPSPRSFQPEYNCQCMLIEPRTLALKSSLHHEGRDGNVRILEGSHRQQKITSLWQSGAVLFWKYLSSPILIIFTLTLGVFPHANAETRLARPVPDSQRLIIENNNLSADTFFTAYMSKTSWKEDMRRCICSVFWTPRKDGSGAITSISRPSLWQKYFTAD